MRPLMPIPPPPVERALNYKLIQLRPHPSLLVQACRERPATGRSCTRWLFLYLPLTAFVLAVLYVLVELAFKQLAVWNIRRQVVSLPDIPPALQPLGMPTANPPTTPLSTPGPRPPPAPAMLSSSPPPSGTQVPPPPVSPPQPQPPAPTPRQDLNVRLSPAGLYNTSLISSLGDNAL